MEVLMKSNIQFVAFTSDDNCPNTTVITITAIHDNIDVDAQHKFKQNTANTTKN